jgi:cytochrome c oxidase subunit II
MRLRLKPLFGLVGLGAVPSAFAAWDLNMRKGVTEISHAVYDLHMTIFWICVAIGVVVFGVMFYSMYHHRKSRGAVADDFHESTKLEVIWTAIPFAILVIMAIPATQVLIKMYDASDSDIDIKVMGYQWKWSYEYLGQDLGNGDNLAFFSNLSTPREEVYNEVDKNPNYLLEVDEPLVIPANKKVRFLISANDVIHAFWVPDFAVKKDAIPGFINEAWTIVPEPGIYRGQCAELCGEAHGYMPIVVKVVPENEYVAWVENKRQQVAMARGIVPEVAGK